jgi:hypothetical protein
MNKHLKKYIKNLYFKNNESAYYLASTFCNESFIDFDLLAKDFDFFIEIISNLKTKTIIKKLKDYNSLNKHFKSWGGCNRLELKHHDQALSY